VLLQALAQHQCRVADFAWSGGVALIIFGCVLILIGLFVTERRRP
jgi:hypothetical protein